MSEMSREDLLQVVRTLWEERDPVPEGLVARMQAVVATASTDLDEELMLLVERSTELAGARGTAAYTLRFEHGELNLLLRVASEDGRARLDGWVTPASPMTVRASSVADELRTWDALVDERGRFELENLPAGLVRLRLEAFDAGGSPFATPAFEI